MCDFHSICLYKLTLGQLDYKGRNTTMIIHYTIFVLCYRTIVFEAKS